MAPGARRDVPFTHVSTDYVFDGEAERPYDTDDPPNPLQVYGETKLAGDRAVREHHPDPTVARLSFVYGVHRSREELIGFPAWVRSRLADSEPTPLFTDQWVTPTRAGQAAGTLLDLHDARATGLYHVACRSCVTPYEFGDRIRERMERSPDLLRRGSRADVERAARRPTYTCLDTGGVESTLGRAQPTLAEDLAAIGSAFE